MTRKISRFLRTILPLAALCLHAAADGKEAVPAWQKAYTGDDATGPEVIALWQFAPSQAGRDSSGRGHDLTLRGQARFLTEGPFGGCLESFPAGESGDRPQGAVAKYDPRLSPAGAFTLELWFKPKPEIARAGDFFLIDKKYYNYAKDIPEANWDYCLCLVRSGKGRFRLQAHLGYGRDSAVYSSSEIELPPGRWRHLAFAYDGAGTARFFVDGRPAGRMFHEGRGPVAPGRYDLVIGDRYGSVHSGCPGCIAQVRLSGGIVPDFSGGLDIDPAGGRTAFVRMEKNAAVSLTLSNDTGRALDAGSVRIAFAGEHRSFVIPALPSKGKRVLSVPVDTALRPGVYPMEVAASISAGARSYRTRESFSVVIAPRPLPGRMPVVMWGYGDLPRLKQIGFTHVLASLQDYGRIWEAGRPVQAQSAGDVAESARMLDEYLGVGIGAVAYTYPGSWLASNPALKSRFDRIDRFGQPRGHDNVCASFPEVQMFGYNVGASIARTYGTFPALQSSLIHSEVRDATDLCFHPHDRAACWKATGEDIPLEIQSKAGLSRSGIKGFPDNQILPDNDRILRFYRWFWKDGDGWNRLHTRVHEGLKSTGRKDLWTFFDPAVRVPSVWGSGGGVDVLSQWTYSYPDPIKIGQATDELFAMAAGRPGQQVMKMTQIIWYRSGTAPKLPLEASRRATWEKQKPDAEFITIAPDHLREAFWSKMSRPIRGIMYHGWESLVDTGSTRGYRFTHPQTAATLADLIRTVVRPLGPALLQVPDRKSDVALLESFSSQVFAGRGASGWSEGWEADMHLILQWARIQPKILYEETVLRDGLGDYRVLVMPYCDVLTESVARKVKAFQKRGGIVVADEYLTPALVPDIVVPAYTRTGRARADKAALQARASGLRRELDPFYTRYGDSGSSDVVVRFRKYRDSDYLFALNDRRAFGNYVGCHGLVMEKGLPHSGGLLVRRSGGYVYDLVSHRPVPSKAGRGALRFSAAFAPGGGRLFLITPGRIAGVRLTAPAKGKLGRPIHVSAAVVDGSGRPVPAVVPVEVAVLDPLGRSAEKSGFYGARDGRLALTLDLARNDLPGRWTLRVRELAAGRERALRFAVTR
ncbi:MAG: LamG domain-containing protein [Armatimonadetes bacterium]|nr:LamG domain-containing protein [Armatimonadota bacterium]